MHAQLETPQGSINLSPMPSKSGTLRVASLALCTAAIAAIRASNALAGRPAGERVTGAAGLHGEDRLGLDRAKRGGRGPGRNVPSKRWASSRPSRALSGSWRALTPTRRARHLCDPCLRRLPPECPSHASVTPTTAGPRQAPSGPRGDRAARLGSRAGSCVRTRSGIDRPARRREHSCKGRQAG